MEDAAPSRSKSRNGPRSKSRNAPKTTLFRDALLADGSYVDIEVQNDIVVGHHSPGEFKTQNNEPLETVFLDGLLTLPALVEPHAHLDKALSSTRVKNPTGDLMGAIEVWSQERSQISHTDYVERAFLALELALTNGTTAVRTHVDVGGDVGTRGIDALLEVQAQVSKKPDPAIDLQIVALGSSPLTGKQGRKNLVALEAAVENGADLVGSVPALDPDPAGCISLCLGLAKAAGLGVDLHIDETLDREVLTIKELCKQVLDGGVERPNSVTASHCVSLGMQSPTEQKTIATEIQAAGINVVALPQTNLYLQARGIRQSPPRGLTAVETLEEIGVTYAAGGDNLQDPFNLMGRGDPLETASLMVTMGHHLPNRAFQKITDSARQVMGLNLVGPAVGNVADFLCIRAKDTEQAIALAPAERRTYRSGRLVGQVSEVRKVESPHF